MYNLSSLRTAKLLFLSLGHGIKKFEGTSAGNESFSHVNKACCCEQPTAMWSPPYLHTCIPAQPDGSACIASTDRFKPRLPMEGQCRRVLGQDSEPLVAPGEQVGALHGFLHHRCINECVNGFLQNLDCRPASQKLREKASLSLITIIKRWHQLLKCVLHDHLLV